MVAGARCAGDTAQNFHEPETDPRSTGRILRVSLPVVDIRGLHVRFGEVEAVAGIDVQADAGQATALLGRNGAGKSTTMRVLAGLVPPTAGSVVVDGMDMRSHTLAIKQISGYCPDVGGLVPRATPWEHLQLSARLRRLDHWEDRARDLLERFELGDVAHRVTGGFSHGMGRRLSVVLASLHEPKLRHLRRLLLGLVRAEGADLLELRHLLELRDLVVDPVAPLARLAIGHAPHAARDARADLPHHRLGVRQVHRPVEMHAAGWHTRLLI